MRLVPDDLNAVIRRGRGLPFLMNAVGGGGTPPPQWAIDAVAILDWPDAPETPSSESGYINLF